MTAWSMSQRGPHKGMHNIIILIYHSIWCVFSPSPSIWCYLYVFYIHVCARINVKAHWDKGRFGSRSGFCRCLTSCQSGLRKGLGKGPGLDSRQMISDALHLSFLSVHFKIFKLLKKSDVHKVCQNRTNDCQHNSYNYIIYR